MTEFQKFYAGEKVCCTCRHYIQHYGRGKRKYYILSFGHCIFPRVKSRAPEQTCGHWAAIKEEPASPS